MTDLDLDALEAVARASTHQESWKVTDLRDAPDGHRDCIWIDTDDVATYATVAEMNDEDGLFPLWGIEDATHIAAFDPPTVLALIERVERAEAALPPCDGGCDYNSGPEETCSAHGRPVAEVWQMEGIALRALSAAEERAGQAEARIAAALEGHTEKHGERARFAPGSPYLGEPVPTHWEKYVICDYCKTTWPCKTFTALTVESENAE